MLVCVWVWLDSRSGSFQGIEEIWIEKSKITKKLELKKKGSINKMIHCVSHISILVVVIVNVYMQMINEED